jgi:hypothetical protein
MLAGQVQTLLTAIWPFGHVEHVVPLSPILVGQLQAVFDVFEGLTWFPGQGTHWPLEEPSATRRKVLLRQFMHNPLESQLAHVAGHLMQRAFEFPEGL